MKEQKLKRYRLGVSRTFPSTHPKKGHATCFINSILNAIEKIPFDPYTDKFKLHTIRNNYDLWVKRMAEVQSGRAVIELFYWSGKPYRSKQVVFAVLDENSGCGVQELDFMADNIERPCIFGNGYAVRSHISILAYNDGLSLDDFKAWFKNYDLSKPKAIIQFTNLRY